MARRYLFGPVTPAFADQNLNAQRQVGDCLAFDPGDTTDLAIAPGDSWEAVTERLPRGWRPDFIVLYLPYTTIPKCLWTAPVPLIGLAADWNLLWHALRRRLRSCDLVLTDPAGVDALQRAGIDHVRAANLFGCERSFLEEGEAAAGKDIDVLFVGNLQPAVQRERLPWLARLSRLSERCNVCIRTGVFGADYRELLGRSRIVFNRGIRGEGNRRVFEAACAGALLFQEEGNSEVPSYFRDRQECVYYNADNLETRLEYYLEHEKERRGLAEAARAKVPAFSFESLWEDYLRLIDFESEALAERARQRPTLDTMDELLARTWQALGSTDEPEPSLVRDLAAALVAQPQSPSLHNALGLAVALTSRRRSPITAAVAQKAAGYFQRAVAADPSHVVAGLNLVEALVGMQQTPKAIEQAQRTLAALERQKELDPVMLDSGHFPPAFDHFRVEWERAAWINAGQPDGEARAKRDLLRWRLHLILAELTGSLAHYYEAAMARPDLPITHAALGHALARANEPTEAVIHLRRALEGNPFDLDSSRALFQVLG
ncbi:MAG TPA: glycosyltransferase, partial [Gemmataceae bacterium]|nr:glycosyltransferase [Gemmataceae bacterium]